MGNDAQSIQMGMGAIAPQWNNHALFRLAAAHGHVPWMQHLLPHSDPQACNNEALRKAAANGHLTAVLFLLPLCDATANDSEALRMAAHNGHWDVAQALVPHSDVSARKSEALLWACIRGNVPLAQMLLPHCAPEHLEEMRHSATLNNHADIVALFPPSPSANPEPKAPATPEKESLWLTWTNKVIKKRPPRQW